VYTSATFRIRTASITTQAGFLAQKRLARGLKLNQTEATALIASQLQERIRDGNFTVAQLMQLGKEMLGRRHVMPSVPSLLHEIQVEGTFPDGRVLDILSYPGPILIGISEFYRVFLVTVHDPICTDSGSLSEALYGSFLPHPSEDSFPLEEPALYSSNNAPGAVVVRREPIRINQGRLRTRLRVTNNGDRPIQVGEFQPSPEVHAESKNRLAHITTSSKQTSSSHSIESNPTESDSIYLLAQPFVSNQAMLRQSTSSRSPAHRSFQVATISRVAP
jgi:urease gamma subunit